MYSLDLYRRVRCACHVEGKSSWQAEWVFGLHRETVSKMLRFSVPPGDLRSQPPGLSATKVIMQMMADGSAIYRDSENNAVRVDPDRILHRENALDCNGNTLATR